MSEPTRVLSACEKYRYLLSRVWDADKSVVTSIGLNPSTADHDTNDATLRRCIGFAQSWGYGGLFMVNLFGFRSREPSDLQRTEDPVGQDNDDYLFQAMRESAISVAAWGAADILTYRQHYKNPHYGRDKHVIDLAINLHYLKRTNGGFPGHPLYLKKTLQPMRWEQ